MIRELLSKSPIQIYLSRIIIITVALLCFAHELSAQNQAKDSMERLIKYGNNKKKLETYFYLANFYLEKKQYDLALKYYYYCIDYPHKKLESKDAAVLNKIGLIYMEVGEKKKAIETFFNIISIIDTTRDVERLIGSYNNIGMTFYSLNNMPDALKYIELAKSNAIKIRSVKSIAGANLNLGIIYSKLEKYSQSIKLLDSALVFFNDSMDLYHYATACENKGYALLGMGLNNESKQYLYKGLKISQDNGYKDLIQYCYQDLGDLYRKINKPDSASICYQIVIAYNDSLTLIEASNKVGNMMVQYVQDTKNKEIFILQQEFEINKLLANRRSLVFVILLGFIAIAFLLFYMVNKQRQLKKEKRNMFLKQQVLRLQMNPHFLSNLLSAIQGFIFSGDKIIAGKLLADFSSLTRSILENSREEFIPLCCEITFLKSYLDLQQMRFSSKFNYSIVVDPKLDTENTAIIPMLGQPFVENAIEHGVKHLPSGGMIIINYSIDGNSLLMEIKDNGKGRKASALIEQKPEKHKSLSIQITKDRLLAIEREGRSHLDISDILNDKNEVCGTQVKISIPLKKIPDDKNCNH